MKHIYLFTLTLLMFGSASAQKTDLTKDRILIGKVQKSGTMIVTHPKNLLRAMNEQFPDNAYDRVEIKQGTTIGDKKESFYYVSVSSGSTGAKVLRWLYNNNDMLYMVNTPKGDVSYKDFYVSCRGTGNCKPNLYAEGLEMNWICGDNPGEKTEKEKKECNCEKEVSIVAASLFN